MVNLVPSSASSPSLEMSSAHPRRLARCSAAGVARTVHRSRWVAPTLEFASISADSARMRDPLRIAAGFPRLLFSWLAFPWARGGIRIRLLQQSPSRAAQTFSARSTVLATPAYLAAGFAVLVWIRELSLPA